MDTSATSYLTLSSSIEGPMPEPVMEQTDAAAAKQSTDKLTTGIKYIGAAAVAAAMAIFLFEGINVTNDIQRFITILGFGALLTAVGLLVNSWLADRVASRLFIGLSLTSIPVITTVLGGLVFSLTDASKALSLPTYATWKLAETASLWVALPLGFLVVSAIAYLGLLIMARSEARWMAPALLASNVLVLLPTRDSYAIAVLASASIAALVWLLKRKQVNPISFQTIEGRWALAILFLAPIILIARTVLLYQSDFFMSLCLSGVIYAMVRPVFHAIEENTHIELISLLVSAVAVTVAVTSLVFFMSHSISDVLPSMLSGSALTSMQKILQSLLLVFGSALLLTACYDMARKKNIRRETRFIQFLACAAVGLVIVSMDIISISSGISVIVALILLSAFILLYYSRDWLMEACILLISLTTLLIQHADVMLHHVLSTGWWGLAGLGMMTIVGSALMERISSRRSPEVLTRQN